MKRLAIVALLLMGALSFTPARTQAFLPGFVAPPNSVSGTVTDDAGDPVPNVFVFSTDFSIFGSTDAQGQYVFDGLTTGTEYTMQAGDFGGVFLPGTSAPVVISDTATAVADIVLQRVPTTSVSGTVLDANGLPLAGIEVRDATAFNVPPVVTGADGTYRLPGLPLGQFHLFTAFDPAGSYQSASTEFMQIADDGSTVVDFTLSEAPFNVSGVVVDAQGSPVQGVRVDSNFFGGASSDTAGRFRLFLPTGPTTLFVSDLANRFRRQQVDVDVPATGAADVTITVQEMPTIDVTVLADGLPVADARVTATSGFVQLPRETGADGTVSLPIETDGSYTLLVEPPGFDHLAEYYPDAAFPDLAVPIAVTAGSHVPVTVTLERAASVAGSVTGPDGMPVAAFVTAAPIGVDLTANPILSPCTLDLFTNPVGTYRVGCLRAGQTYVLRADTFGQFDVQFYRDAISPARATPVTVATGEQQTGADFHLHAKTPDPTVYGLSRSYFLAGTTTRGVHLYGSEFPLDATALDTFVETEFNGPDTTMKVTRVLNAGEALVDVTVAPTSGGNLFGRSIVLNRTTGGTALCAGCFLVGDRATPVGSASGKVTDSNDRPVAGIQVQFSSPTFGNLSVMTGSDGKYSIGGLRPGTYTVEFLGNERLASGRYKATRLEPLGRPVTIVAGKSVNGVNGELRRRGPITFTGVNPSSTGISVEVDAIGTGLGSIRGGFRVRTVGPSGSFPANVSTAADGSLHISTFASPGTYDLVLEWTRDAGTTGRITCAGCLTVSEPAQLFPFSSTTFLQGSTANSLILFGNGVDSYVDVTGDNGVTVTGFSSLASLSIIGVTLDVAADAPLGAHDITFLRNDGATAIVTVFVEPAQPPV